RSQLRPDLAAPVLPALRVSQQRRRADPGATDSGTSAAPYAAADPRRGVGETGQAARYHLRGEIAGLGEEVDGPGQGPAAAPTSGDPGSAGQRAYRRAA